MKRYKISTILSVLGLIGLIIIFYINRGQLKSVFHLLGDLRWYVIVLVCVVQIFSYWVNGLYYRSILRIFGYEISIKRLFEGALATNFVNYILPTAGMAGAGFLSQVLAKEVPRGKSVLTQLMRYALSALAVLIMMPLGFVLILLSHDSAHPIVRVTIISALVITVLAFIIVGFIYQEKLLRHFLKWLINNLKRIFPKINIDGVRNFVDDFYAGFHAMVKQKRNMLIPFSWSITYILIEIGTFYMAFLAFGKVIDPGIAIMAYLFANIASILGGVFFSVGVFEVGMAGTLVALGQPFAFAVSVTALYRVLNLLIGLPPGAFYYRKFLPKRAAKQKSTV